MKKVHSVRSELVKRRKREVNLLRKELDQRNGDLLQEREDLELVQEKELGLKEGEEPDLVDRDVK